MEELNQGFSNISSTFYSAIASSDQLYSDEIENGNKDPASLLKALSKKIKRDTDSYEIFGIKTKELWKVWVEWLKDHKERDVQFEKE